MFRKKKHHRHSGYTLIELSITVLVISLILAGVITIQNQKIRVEQREIIERKLDLISKVLYNYRLLNSRLPCPGNASLALSDDDFGVAADGASGACNLGATISSNINSSGNDVFGGSVPVRTLGLPDDVGFDPWGNQFTYYLDKNANVTDAFNGEDGTNSLADTNKLNVQDESGATLAEDVLAVVLSHGSNGHGGYNSAGMRVNAGSTNLAEQGNCMCDDATLPNTVADRFIRIQRTMPTSSTDFTTNFDDIGRFYPKSYFYTYAERYP